MIATLRPLAAGCVLVADEDDAHRKRARKCFEAAGYHVIEAASAERAVAASRTAHVDALLLDVMLADGCALLAAVRDDALLREAKVVLTSASRDGLREVAAISVDVDAFFDKRRRGHELVDLVADLLARRDGILAALEGGAWGPLSDVGVQSLLRFACDARLRGVLTVDDSVTTWRVSVRDGHIVSARASTRAGEERGLAALASLLDVPDAPFVFEPDADVHVADDACADDAYDEDALLRANALGSWRAVARAVADNANALRAARRRPRVQRPAHRPA